ncbi:hypothetical protein NDU88_002862 [Pleurodeles waltl]|uniref:Uncharacterized protein n=1 Tax=Pleurodeles waltl TaxID=8319 RepID=A0AAV7LH46_PLEWA|nr:hypothetical protein NDU88_002862 [Pleurodeles waltl]
MVCDWPARYGPFTNPNCTGAATSAPVPQDEAANPESLPAMKAGPERSTISASEWRTARNGEVSSSAGGQNCDHRRKPEGEEELDYRANLSASQEA